MNDSIKKDYPLNVNDYNQLQVISGKDTKVHMICNILFGDEYMYPSIPDDVFLNIARYRFRELNEATMASIKNKLQDKVDKFIPDNDIEEILVTKDNDNENTIIILIKFIGDDPDEQENKNNTDFISLIEINQPELNNNSNLNITIYN